MNANKLVGLVVLGVAVSAAALAADSSATINVRKNITPSGVQPTVSVLRATSTVATTFTVDLPAPRGVARIVGWDCNVRSALGDLKNLRVSETVAGTLTVTSSVSNSLAVGDTMRCLVVTQ